MWSQSRKETRKGVCWFQLISGIHQLNRVVLPTGIAREREQDIYRSRGLEVGQSLPKDEASKLGNQL